MSLRSHVVMFALWVISIITIGVLVSAQTRPAPPAVITGNDIGFRADAVQPTRDRLRGTFVVRVNGQWIEAQIPTRGVPAVH